MALTQAVILHVGSIPELSLVEYLYRVLFHLLAFGGLALLVHWAMELGGVTGHR